MGKLIKNELQLYCDETGKTLYLADNSVNMGKYGAMLPSDAALKFPNALWIISSEIYGQSMLKDLRKLNIKNENIIKKTPKKIIFRDVPLKILPYSETKLDEYKIFYKKEIETIAKNAKKISETLQAGELIKPATKKLQGYREIFSALDYLGNILIVEQNGKKRIYRGIRPEKISFFIKLYRKGILQALADSGRFVNIKFTDYKTEDYPMIIEIETLKIIPKTKYTFTMIRDAAINMLVINNALEKFGYTLIDGHMANTTFKGNKPIFFDIGSVINITKTGFYNDLEISCLKILAMLSINKSFFAKSFLSNEKFLPLRDFDNSIEVKTLMSQFLKYHKKHSCGEYNYLLHEVFKKKYFTAEYIHALFDKYQYTETAWGTYSENFFKEQKEPRMERILELISQFCSDIRSSIDIAGNYGFLSYLLSKNNSLDSIINLDYDENALERGRNLLKNNNIDLYLTNFVSGNLDFISEVKSDIVFALALTHHLILTERYHIDYIFSRISDYSKKYVVIEFSPLGMYDGGNLPCVPDWYTDQWFQYHFEKFFNILHKETIAFAEVQNQKYPHRILYIGQKK